MNKREWLLAATALSAVLVTSDAFAQAQPQRASRPGQIGATGAVNPASRATRPSEATRVLMVGSELFQNERIQTDAGGQAHLLFADQSALTVGPNSDVTLDRFVYDPARDTGSLAVQAGRGVLRFVGGRVSKDGDVSIRTPAGTIGIRGGIAIIQILADGSVFVAFLFGEYVDVAGYRLARQGYGMKIGDASPHQLTPQELQALLALLQGGNNPPGGRTVIVENGQFPPWIAPDWAQLMANGFGGLATGDWRGVDWRRFEQFLSESNNQIQRHQLNVPPPPPPPPPPFSGF